MSLPEARKMNGRMMTALRKDERASAAWASLCSLPPRAGKNVKKRVFLFNWASGVEADGRSFGPSFWAESQDLVSEDLWGTIR